MNFIAEPDGATISFGGFTTQRHPMAFIYELLRPKRRSLYLFGHSPGGDWDILIGAGCVKRLELAYEADEAFNTIGPRLRFAVQRGVIEWEDHGNFSMVPLRPELVIPSCFFRYAHFHP